MKKLLLMLFFALPFVVIGQTYYDKKQDMRLTTLETKTNTIATTNAAQKITIDSLRNRITILENIRFYRPVIWLKGLEFCNDTLRIQR